MQVSQGQCWPAVSRRETHSALAGSALPPRDLPVRAEDTVIRERGIKMGKWGNRTAFPRGTESSLQDTVIVKLKKKKKIKLTLEGKNIHNQWRSGQGMATGTTTKLGWSARLSPPRVCSFLSSLRTYHGRHELRGTCHTAAPRQPCRGAAGPSVRRGRTRGRNDSRGGRSVRALCAGQRELRLGVVEGEGTQA